MTFLLLLTKKLKGALTFATGSNARIRSCLLTKWNTKNHSPITKTFISTMQYTHRKALILFPVIVVLVNVTRGIPNHGLQTFLGYDYWVRRYPSLGYTDWDGFWNNYHSGRIQYKRASSETTGQACTPGCQCEQELECSGNLEKL